MEYVLRKKILFTPGNHDYMFYYFIKFPKSHLGRAWLYNGYETTLASYNNRYEKITEHLDLITAQPIFVNHEDCFISHAGISAYYKSKFPKNFQNDLNSVKKIIDSDVDAEHGVLWTRDRLLNLGKLQIVGHTRQAEVLFVKENNTAYIDTSVYTGNKLSAVIVENNRIVEIISIPTYIEDIE
jgi:serine/threonine protein phosphatase 1